MSCCESKAQSCCVPTTKIDRTAAQIANRVLEVEFLYLDLKVCERCQGTDQVLKEAVDEANRILRPMGVDVTLKMIHVESEEQARTLGFVSSPTIRLMGRDAAIEVKEDSCKGCSTVGGCDITCRVWTWQGKEFSVPPKALLLDAILRAAYLHPDGVKLIPEPIKDLPENLKRFFQGAHVPSDGESCCSP
jgi:hypothetical protein